MSIFPGWADRARGLFADSRGPWGPSGGGTPPSGGNGGGDPPRPGPSSPWGSPGPRQAGLGGNVTSLDDFLARSKARFGGGGGGGTGVGGPGFNRKAILLGLVALVALWLFFTTVHRIAPEERGVVTQLGKYSRTLNPGIGLTLPAPFERVQKIDVENIRNVDLGSVSEETLMLTGDQNIIDLAYSVSWNINDPSLFLFQLADPEETIREVAESAMRAVVGTVSLNDAIGAGRTGKALQLLGERALGQVGVAAGMKLDHRSAEAERCVDLRRFGLDEKGHADAGGAKFGHKGTKLLQHADGVEPAFGGAFLPLFGDDAGGMGASRKGDAEHLLRRRHFEVEGERDLILEADEIVFADVAAILAQVGGDAVGARSFREMGGADGIGKVAAPGIPDGRDMVDVDAEAKRPAHARMFPKLTLTSIAESECSQCSHC